MSNKVVMIGRVSRIEKYVSIEFFEDRRVLIFDINSIPKVSVGRWVIFTTNMSRHKPSKNNTIYWFKPADDSKASSWTPFQISITPTDIFKLITHKKAYELILNKLNEIHTSLIPKVQDAEEIMMNEEYIRFDNLRKSIKGLM